MGFRGRLPCPWSHITERKQPRGWAGPGAVSLAPAALERGPPAAPSRAEPSPLLSWIRVCALEPRSQAEQPVGTTDGLCAPANTA